MITPYPAQPRERDRWIVAHRTRTNQLDPFRPHAFLLEQERAESGEAVSVATIFLTNRECPWRCLMCDLWKNTLPETVPPGAIPAQIDHALAELKGGARVADTLSGNSGDSASAEGRSLTPDVTSIRQVKLYNSGSFFDPRAIPPEEHAEIAQRVAAFERVIVECHPALVSASALRFRDLLAAARGSPQHNPAPEGINGRPEPMDAGACRQLEVAMGLETAHPQVLDKLNKRMSLGQFQRAAEFLCAHEIALRVFILVKPPFLGETEALHWTRRSIDFAFDCGAAVVSLIPTRFGNGALEALAGRGEFSPPKLSTLESAHEYGIGVQRGRVFADLWDLEKFSDCVACFAQRRARLHDMNLGQVVVPPVVCDGCHGGAA